MSNAEPSPRPWHFNGMRPTIYSDEPLPDGSARVVLDIKTDHLPLLPCDENDRQLIADLALIVEAVNERNRLKAVCADLWRAVKRIEADSRLALGHGAGVASSALHYVHTYASSAIRAAEKKGFAP